MHTLFQVTHKPLQIREDVEKAFQRFRKNLNDGQYTFLQQECWSENTQMVERAVEQLQKFPHVVVLGTGGSSLGGQALRALVAYQNRENVRLQFLDDIDPVRVKQLFEGLDFRNTGFLVISKSGYTAETLAHALMLECYFEGQGWQDLLGTNCVFISHNSPSPLTRMAQKWQATLIPHNEKVGGRFSVLTVVGSIILRLLGGSVQELYKGAFTVLSDLQNKDEPDILKSVSFLWAAYERGLKNQVLMPYCAAAIPLSVWYRQLSAESLGKNGHGITPILASGTIDQHSQLQLYLDGPQDKIFTFFSYCERNHSILMKTDDPEIQFLNDRTLGDLFISECKATKETISHRGYPLRDFQLSDVSEAVWGGLFVYFMVETILLADLLCVNPFDQPAVEEGKRLTRKFMMV